jgi:hypothetical protein
LRILHASGADGFLSVALRSIDPGDCLARADYRAPVTGARASTYAEDQALRQRPA